MTRTLLAHHRKYSTSDVHRTNEVCGKLTFNLHWAKLFKVTSIEITCIIEQYINAPESFNRGLCSRLSLGGASYIQFDD